MKCHNRIFWLITLLLGEVTVLSAENVKPAAPVDEWQGTNFNTSHSASVSSVKPFDPSVHEKMTPSGSLCSEQLNAAIYRQDILHAFESYAHYDNCAFSDTYEYIQSLLKKGDKSFRSTPIAWADSDTVPKSVLEGMLNLGQVLHAVQDFYAHTNYVELVQKIQPTPDFEHDIPLVKVWTDQGNNKIKKLIKKGLVSGRVWWTLPHQCSEGALTHAQLAKDTATTSAGSALSIWKRPIGNKKQKNYNIAYNLAHRGTREFIQWSGEQWPQIEKYCGKTLKYIIIKDRRQASLPENK